jgi:uncharacterized protein RhaS with RHS repeats
MRNKEYRARYYNPTLGRFISRDPLSGAEFSQGTNLYAYCRNNFLNSSDPTGMCWLSDYYNNLQNWANNPLQAPNLTLASNGNSGPNPYDQALNPNNPPPPSYLAGNYQVAPLEMTDDAQMADREINGDPTLNALSDPNAVNGAQQMIRDQVEGADYVMWGVETAVEGPAGAAQGAMVHYGIDAGLDVTGFGEPDPTPTVGGQ